MLEVVDRRGCESWKAELQILCERLQITSMRRKLGSLFCGTSEDMSGAGSESSVLGGEGFVFVNGG